MRLQELLSIIEIYEKQGMDLDLPVVFTDEDGVVFDFVGIVNQQERISIAIKKQ